MSVTSTAAVQCVLEEGESQESASVRARERDSVWVCETSVVVALARMRLKARQRLSGSALRTACWRPLSSGNSSSPSRSSGGEREHVDVVVVITHLQLKMSALLPTFSLSLYLSRSGRWLCPFMKCKRFACGFSCFLLTARPVVVVLVVVF